MASERRYKLPLRMYPRIRDDHQGADRGELQQLADWFYMMRVLLQTVDTKPARKISQDLMRPNGVWEWLYGRQET